MYSIENELPHYNKNNTQVGCSRYKISSDPDYVNPGAANNTSAQKVPGGT